MKITEARWMFLDTETTGLKPANGDRMVQLAWTTVSFMQIEGSAMFLVNPERPVGDSVKIHRISDEMLASEPTFREILPKFLPEFEEADFIAAWNANFDKDVLENECRLAGVALPSKTWVDPIYWSRKFRGTFAGNKLADLAGEFSIDLSNAHRADADVKASVEVMLRFFEWGLSEANFPDDVDQMVLNQNKWKDEYDQGKKLYRGLPYANGKPAFMSKPQVMPQDIYDGFMRERLMKLNSRGRWGK